MSGERNCDTICFRNVQKYNKASVWMLSSLQLHYNKLFCGESHMTKCIWLVLQQIFQQKQNVTVFPRHFLILAICRLRKTKQVTIITLCLLPMNMCNFIIIIKYFRWNQDTSNLRVYLILLNSSMIEPHLLRSVIVKYSCPNLSTWASNINLLLILHCYILFSFLNPGSSLHLS